jgi:hypothetical protein
MKRELTLEVLELLNGKNLDNKQHEAFMLLTIDEENWPHTAMISVGEIVAKNAQEVYLGLWPETTTTKNIIRSKKATLVFFFQGKAYYIKLSLKQLPLLHHAKYKRERFIGKVENIREDRAKYASITSGVQINLNNPEEVIQRWEETINEISR